MRYTWNINRERGQPDAAKTINLLVVSSYVFFARLHMQSQNQATKRGVQTMLNIVT